MPCQSDVRAQGELGRGQTLTGIDPRTVLAPKGIGWHVIRWVAEIAEDCDAAWTPRIRIKSGAGTAVETIVADAKFGQVTVMIGDTASPLEVAMFADRDVSQGSTNTKVNVFHWPVSTAMEWVAKYTSDPHVTPVSSFVAIPVQATKVSILSDQDIGPGPAPTLLRFLEYTTKASGGLAGNTLVPEGQSFELSGFASYYKITGTGGTIRVVFTLSR